MSLRGGRQHHTTPGTVPPDVTCSLWLRGRTWGRLPVEWILVTVSAQWVSWPWVRVYRRRARWGRGRGAAGLPSSPLLPPCHWPCLLHRAVSDPKSVQFSGTSPCLTLCRCWEGPGVLGPSMTPASLSAPSTPCPAGPRPSRGPSVMVIGSSLPQTRGHFLAQSTAFPR